MNNIEQEIIKFKGVVIDIPPMELMQQSVWTDGRNITFDDGATERVGGYARFADPLPVTPAAEPVFMHPVLTPNESYWIYIDDDGLTVTVYVTNGTAHYDITPAGGLTVGGPGIWTGTTLNGIPVLNNGKNYPFWWNGEVSSPCEILPDWPANTYAKSIRAYKYHLMALNITRDGVDIPNLIMWSAAADPTTVPASWTPEPGNDAGDAALSEKLGGLVDAEPLRDQLVIYRQHSTALCNYVAGQYVFNFRELFNTSGIQAINCAAEVRGRHYVITDDDIIVHDGNQFKTIVDNVIRYFLFRGINPEKQQLCCTAARTSKDEIWFCFPTVDSTYLDIAAVWSLEDEVFGIRMLPEITYARAGIIPDQGFDRSWDGALLNWQDDPRFWNEANYSITQDGLLMCTPDTHRLLHVDAANDNDGEPVEAYVERTFHTVGGQNAIWQNVLTNSIWPNITGSDGDKITIRIGGSQSPTTPITWGNPVVYTIGEQPPHIPKVDTLVYGRFLCMRFSSSGGDPWQLHRIGIEYSSLGKY